MSRAPCSFQSGHVDSPQIAEVIAVSVAVLVVVIVVAVEARRVTGRRLLLQGAIRSQTGSDAEGGVSHDSYRSDRRLFVGRADHVEARDGHLEDFLFIFCKRNRMCFRVHHNKIPSAVSQ